MNIRFINRAVLLLCLLRRRLDDGCVAHHASRQCQGTIERIPGRTNLESLKQERIDLTRELLR